MGRRRYVELRGVTDPYRTTLFELDQELHIMLRQGPEEVYHSKLKCRTAKVLNTSPGLC